MAEAVYNCQPNFNIRIPSIEVSGLGLRDHSAVCFLAPFPLTLVGRTCISQSADQRASELVEFQSHRRVPGVAIVWHGSKCSTGSRSRVIHTRCGGSLARHGTPARLEMTARAGSSYKGMRSATQRSYITCALPLTASTSASPSQ